ncbi:hypothetical protein KIPB_005217 [Kipferlia bialata]|uniref:Uncharacterized protein n=1 Tax=Kipferlia bialata TaxID=797122 RepID=A0A391NW68_9EUKA|nr:hypothetical protein KIPB_005217 [Kipferlia bialata]|eukprot:g5217.t1
MPTLLSAVSCFVVVGLTIVLALVEPVSAHFDGYVFEDDVTTMPEAVMSHHDIPALLGSHDSRLGLFGFRFDYPIVLMHGINTSEYDHHGQHD